MIFIIIFLLGKSVFLFFFLLALMLNIHICCYHHRAKNYTLTYLVNKTQKQQNNFPIMLQLLHLQ